MPGLSFQNEQNVQRKILVELPVPKKEFSINCLAET
jgi:hypothetical protein